MLSCVLALLGLIKKCLIGSEDDFYFRTEQRGQGKGVFPVSLSIVVFFGEARHGLFLSRFSRLLALRRVCRELATTIAQCGRWIASPHPRRGSQSQDEKKTQALYRVCTYLLRDGCDEQHVRFVVNDRGLFTTAWFSVREKYYFNL